MSSPQDQHTTAIRVLVVDDQRLLREGLAMLLQQDSRISVVGRWWGAAQPGRRQ